MSLDIEVMAWFETADFEEFRGFREELLLAFLNCVTAAGAHLAQEDAGRKSPERPAS